MIRLLNLFKSNLSEWKIQSPNYVNWEYDEELGENYPSLNKKSIQRYLESVIDPEKMNAVEEWMNDPGKNGFDSVAFYFFDAPDQYDFTDASIKEWAKGEMSNWLYGNFDEFPYKDND